MLRDEDIRIDVGRAEGGDFVRVTHVPSGISRTRMPPIGGTQRDVIRELRAEIEAELRGMSQG